MALLCKMMWKEAFPLFKLHEDYNTTDSSKYKHKYFVIGPFKLVLNTWVE